MKKLKFQAKPGKIGEDCRLAFWFVPKFEIAIEKIWDFEWDKYFWYVAVGWILIYYFPKERG